MTTYPSGPSGHITSTSDGRRLSVVRTFRAPIIDVWDSLTSPGRVARWYGTIEGEPVAGNTVMITLIA